MEVSTPSKPTDRRTAIADAAIDLLAADGSRGLTHRAVDRSLGLAEGSTSFYFRTRRALLEAAARRIAELNLADADSIFPHLEAGPEMLAASIVHWSSPPFAARQLARIELLLEARRRPEFADIFDAAREQLIIRIADALKAMGAPHDERTAKATLATLEGFIIERLLHPRVGLQPEDLEPALRQLFGGTPGTAP